MSEATVDEDDDVSGEYELTLDLWKEIVDVYIEGNGNQKKAFELLVERGIDIPKVRFLEAVYEGDPAKALPPADEIYKDSVGKAVSRIKAERSERIQNTLMMGDYYKQIMLKKMQSMEQDPRLVTNLIASELKHLTNVEKICHQALEDQDREDGKQDAYQKMSLKEAKQIQRESRLALAAASVGGNPIEVTDIGDAVDEDEYDLKKVMSQNAARVARKD